MNGLFVSAEYKRSMNGLFVSAEYKRSVNGLFVSAEYKRSMNGLFVSAEYKHSMNGLFVSAEYKHTVNCRYVIADCKHSAIFLFVSAAYRHSVNNLHVSAEFEHGVTSQCFSAEHWVYISVNAICTPVCRWRCPYVLRDKGLKLMQHKFMTFDRVNLELSTTRSGHKVYISSGGEPRYATALYTAKEAAALVLTV